MTSNGDRRDWIIRCIATGCFAAVFVCTVVFNAMAGPGIGPFNQSTGDISDNHNLPITPAGFTFSIWAVIYILLGCVVAYVISLLFRKIGEEKAWEVVGTIPVSFLVVLTINLILNISWLFAWDQEQMVAASVVLFIIAATNVISATIAAKGFSDSANKLSRSSKLDFWMSLFTLNSHEIYSMWTIIASLLNLGIAIVDQANEGESVQQLKNNVSIWILSVLLILMIAYFVVEQTVFKRLGNPYFTHYLVYIWAMIGSYSKNGSTEDSTVVGLIIGNLACGAVLFVLRVGFQIFRNRRNVMYNQL